MPTPSTPRARIQTLRDRYVARRGPERAWEHLGPELGYADGKSLKRALERYCPIYGIELPPRVYEHLNVDERRAAEIWGKETTADEASVIQTALTSVVAPAELPIELPSAEELRERRRKQFERKQIVEEAKKLIPVRVRLDGPIGILHFGDPHLDDDGTNIALVERHVEIVNKTKGMLGANVGDTTNNWVGRLARLYGQQSTSAAEAWVLAEWFVSSVAWLYMLAGNHDLWSGAGDPIKWMQKCVATGYQATEARMELCFPNGRKVRVNARHDFSGYSMWNPAHGAMKAAWLGFRDHINTCGHKHISGYGLVKDPDTGVLCHCIQIGSYKLFDRYAKEKGLREQHISPCAVTIIDPDANETGLVSVFHDPAEGAEFLNYKRARKSHRK